MRGCRVLKIKALKIIPVRVVLATRAEVRYSVGMNMESGTLWVSLVVSTVGFGYFTYGRKTQTLAFMLSGGVMMIYGYFIESFGLSLGIGIALAAAPFFVR